MTVYEVERVRGLEEVVLQHPQEPIVTRHLLHAGVYARTVTIPARAVMTGVLIKRATVLIINGDVEVGVGDGSARFTGYHVLPASAHRKQAFIAHADTDLTMLFPTSAQDVQEAEAEFTDEAHRLASRDGQNVVHITGEA